MITRKMQKYLLGYDAKADKDMKVKIKHCVYMNRIQKRIDKELEMLLWLAKNHPDIFLDEEKEFRNEAGRIENHRRLKALLKTINTLKPRMNTELVLNNMKET